MRCGTIHHRRLAVVDFVSLVLLLVLVLLSVTVPQVQARPRIWEEHKLSEWYRLATGVRSGILGTLELFNIVGCLDCDDDGDDGDDDDDNDDHYGEEADEVWQPTTLQVVVVGLGRTGTTSVAMALEKLGYTVFHDDEMFDNHDLATIKNSNQYMDAITWRGYNVSVTSDSDDIEACFERPNCRAILTVRESAEVWVDSWLTALTFPLALESRPFKWIRTVQKLQAEIHEEYHMVPTDGHPKQWLNRTHLMQTYHEYQQDVMDLFRGRDNGTDAGDADDRLLVYNVKEGWGPLCNFLGRPVPTTTTTIMTNENTTTTSIDILPFPRVNDRIRLRGEHSVYVVVTWIWPLPIVLTVWALVCIIQWTYRWVMCKPSTVTNHDSYWFWQSHQPRPWQPVTRRIRTALQHHHSSTSHKMKDC